MTDDHIDALIRRTLAPDLATAERIAAAALAHSTGGSQRRLPVVILWPLTAAMLLAVAALILRPAPQTRVAAVYSVGGLVVGVPTEGTSWIVSPDSQTGIRHLQLSPAKGDYR